MATILELEAAGELVKFDPELAPSELEERHIYLLAETAEKAAEFLPKTQSRWDIESTPEEQLDELVYHFVTGGVLNYPRQFNDLRHKRDGIWELKTADLRLFGWFAQKDCFICADIADANRVKGMGLYAGYCEQTWYRRQNLDLDEPKFVSGTEPKDVVSNCYSF